MLILLIVIVIALAVGGGFYGRECGYTAPQYVGGVSVGAIVLIALIVWLLAGGRMGP